MDKIDELYHEQLDTIVMLGKQNRNHHANWLIVEKQLKEFGLRIDWIEGQPIVKKRDRLG